MSTTAEKTDPKLWDAVKAQITEGDKGGKPGEWSARKAQMAVQAYKAQGGSYKGRKRDDNHLHQWTEEAWGTQSGRDSRQTGERYLPEAARRHLTDAEYQATSAKKRRDTKAGRQFSAQPPSIAAKTARDRHHDGARPTTKAALYAEARRRDIAGRSTMTKSELSKALG